MTTEQRTLTADDLHALLAQETPDGRNAWFEAKESAGDIAGYIADVQRAWDIAEGDPGKSIRYALILASLNSLTDKMPTSLLVSTVKENLWPLEQALTYARRIPDLARRANALLELGQPGEALTVVQTIRNEDKRLEALEALLPRLPEPLLAEALTVAETFEREPCRAEALAAVGARLPRPEGAHIVDEALGLTRAIHDSSSRVYALTRVAVYASAPQRMRALQEGLDVTQAIEDEERRASALAELAPHLSESLLRRGLETAQVIQDDTFRNSALKALLFRLVNIGYSEKAMLMAMAIEDEYDSKKLQSILLWQRTGPNRQRDTAAIVESEPLLSGSMKSTRVVADAAERLHTLVALSPYLPEQEREQVLRDALAAIKRVGDECEDDGNDEDLLERVDALVELAPYLTEPAMREVLNVALSLLERYHEFRSRAEKEHRHSPRAEALAALAPHVPESLLNDTLAAFRTIEDDYVVDHVHTYQEGLLALATRFAEFGLIEEALATTNGQDYLVLRLLERGHLEAAYAVTRRLEHVWGGRGSLRTLANKLAELHHPEESLMAAMKDESEYRRDDTLVKLAPRLLELGHPRTAVSANQGIADIKKRAGVLSGLVSLFSDQQWADVASDAIEIAYSLSWWHLSGREALAALAPRLSEAQWQSFLDKITPESDLERQQLESQEVSFGYAAEKVATHWPNSLLPQVIGVIGRLKESDVRVKLVAGLAARADLTESVLQELLAIARSTLLPRYQAQALSALAPRFPKPLSGEALEAVQTVRWSYDTATWLSRVMPYLSDKDRNKILMPAFTSELAPGYSPFRAQSLVYLALSLSEPTRTLALQKTLEAIQEIEMDWEGNLALMAEKLSPELTEPSLRCLLQIAYTVKTDPLSRIRILVPLTLRLAQLGHPEEAVAAARTIDRQKAERVYSYCCDELSNMACKLVELGHAQAAIASVQAIDDVYSRAKIRTHLVSQLATYDHLQDALSIIELTIKETRPDVWHGDRPGESGFGHRLEDEVILEAVVNSLKDLAPGIARLAELDRSETLLRVLRIAQSLHDPEARDEVGLALALEPCLPEAESECALEQVLAEIQGTKNESHRASRLERFAVKVATQNRLSSVFKIVRRLGYRHQCEVLTALVPHLSERQLQQALTTIQMGDPGPERTETLKALVKCLPTPLIGVAIMEALTIDDRDERVEILQTTAARLPAMNTKGLRYLWKATLHSVATRSREKGLADLGILTPIVVGKEAAAAAARAIQDVGRWWP